ncbi:hypothetical protein P691DRAFT_708730 [Macrolepiota fuliginosa MF-IS2]|uniref:TOG domain-containing protein n=1 Tax=Macrolepiota fuliginosa MF-IS2 TaxID=1400762 RepID=A0A9P6BZL8_9AGAR|nr:hypothetical protein P691DRAFT_708730 [Macrolepiota fuliginosa MF-IS2]
MCANNNELMTLSDFTQSLEKLKPRLSLLETEESWEQILGSLEKLEGLCRLGACGYTSELISFIRSVHRSITNAMNSERTRLSGAALDVLHTLASCLNADFEPLIPLLLPGLLLLCGRTNKVVISRAKSCILTIIETTQLPGVLSHLAHFSKDKSPTIRLMVAEGTLSCLKCFNPPDLEKETHSRDIENIIRSAARDANAGVRKTGKDVFQSYEVLLPHRVNSFAAPLTPTIRKYLQLGNVKVQNKDTTIPLTKRNPTSQSIPSQQANSRSGLAPGPVHSTTISSTASKPNTLTRSLAPLRPIQISAKREEVPTGGAPNQRKLPVVVARPFAPAANATGPQRVIKPAPPEGQRLVSEGKAVKPVPTIRSCPVRSDKPPHTKAGSTTSLVHPPPVRSVKPTRQPSTSKPLPTARNVADDPGRATVGQRNLTRPTLSQMARVKPPVTRPISKPVQGLNIRKTKLPADSGLALKSNPSRAPRTQASRTTAGSTNSTRPATPASIPLPPSPKLSSTRAEGLKPMDGNLSSENDDVQPEVIITHGGDTPSAQRVNSDEHTITPVALDAPNANFNGSCKTPISTLLLSIQQGFNLTPCSPLSPPQHYISSDSTHEPGTFRLGVISQHD